MAPKRQSKSGLAPVASTAIVEEQKSPPRRFRKRVHTETKPLQAMEKETEESSSVSVSTPSSPNVTPQLESNVGLASSPNSESAREEVAEETKPVAKRPKLSKIAFSRWEDEQLKELMRLVSVAPVDSRGRPDWQQIGKQLSPVRTAQAAEQRWKKMNKGWKPSEKARSQVAQGSKRAIVEAEAIPDSKSENSVETSLSGEQISPKAPESTPGISFPADQVEIVMKSIDDARKVEFICAVSERGENWEAVSRQIGFSLSAPHCQLLWQVIQSQSVNFITPTKKIDFGTWEQILQPGIERVDYTQWSKQELYHAIKSSEPEVGASMKSFYTSIQCAYLPVASPERHPAVPQTVSNPEPSSSRMIADRILPEERFSTSLNLWSPSAETSASDDVTGSTATPQQMQQLASRYPQLKSTRVSQPPPETSRWGQNYPTQTISNKIYSQPARPDSFFRGSISSLALGNVHRPSPLHETFTAQNQPQHGPQPNDRILPQSKLSAALQAAKPFPLHERKRILSAQENLFESPQQMQQIRQDANQNFFPNHDFEPDRTWSGDRATNDSASNSVEFPLPPLIPNFAQSTENTSNTLPEVSQASQPTSDFLSRRSSRAASISASELNRKQAENELNTSSPEPNEAENQANFAQSAEPSETKLGPELDAVSGLQLLAQAQPAEAESRQNNFPDRVNPLTGFMSWLPWGAK